MGSRKQVSVSESTESKPAKKSDVKHKLQEFVLQKKQREILNNINNNLGQVSEAGTEETQPSEMESTDAEVSSLLSSSPMVFKALPRISPVPEDENQPVVSQFQFQSSPRSSRSVASPFGEFLGSHGSSSSSLLEEGRGYLGPAHYNPSPPRHGKLRPVGRTQSAPLPLAHPGLLAPPEVVRQGKASPELESLSAASSSSSSASVKAQIRHSLLSRHHQHHRPPPLSSTSEHLKSLDPMSAIAELSQMQTKVLPAEESPKVRHSSTENISRGRPKPISRTRSSPLVSLGTISPTVGSSKTGVAWDPVMLKHSCLCGDDSGHPESPGRLERIMTGLAEAGGLLARCELVRRSATLEELMSCHSHQHVHLYGEWEQTVCSIHITQSFSLGVSPLLRGTGGLAVNRLPCGGWGVDNDTVWNDIHTPSAAKVAAGSIIELVNKGCDFQP